MRIKWKDYKTNDFYDELIGSTGRPRKVASPISKYLSSLGDVELQDRSHAAELAMHVMGITFTVYNDGSGIDRAWPFDIIPRVISAREWKRTEAGLKQRVRALNCFIDDIYHDQRIIKDKVFPKEIIAESTNFREHCVGIDPPLGIWAHICGSDLVRDIDGTMYVLEDNLRVPSGVSYILENRMVMKRVFPELFEDWQAYFHRRGRIEALQGAGYHAMTFDFGGVGGSYPAAPEFYDRDLEDAFLGLAERAGSFPDVLSGGERQRVAIARALVHDPDLILADEPTGNLDSRSGKKILEVLSRLKADLRKTVILATHSTDTAQSADRRLMMRDGRLHGEGEGE